jgi:hypothetical protein
MAAEVKLKPSLEISTPVGLFRMVMAAIVHGWSRRTTYHLMADDSWSLSLFSRRQCL